MQVSKPNSMNPLANKSVFPCPVCRLPLDVRQSKKGKPYVVCEQCGIQMFVRNPAGIRAFNRLVAEGKRVGILEAIAEMQKRYWQECPDCGERFWVDLSRIETSWINGSVEGFRCPQDGCEGLVEAGGEA